MMDRRSLLAAAAVLGVAPGFALARAPAARGTPFNAAMVDQRARALAARRFVPTPPLRPSLHFTYDEYRMLRFHRAQALWQPAPIIAEPMPPGGSYPEPVELWSVERGVASRVPFVPSEFDAPPGRRLPAEPDVGFSGVRFLGPLNRRDVRDEIAVFQGASYFRAVAKGQIYGLSGRAVAVGSGGPAEEFPVFRAFWLERADDPATIRLHALIDGPSLTGACHMTIHPGVQTVMDVDISFFPRTAISAIGIAPMSSMFMSGPASARRFDDFRPAVHDSDGLAIWTGDDERIWRPLHNPGHVEFSIFDGGTPRGFGLIQRARDFADYGDGEAHYEQRPSLWVEPVGDWGHGSVQLIELPTDNETTDNIVAFWRPSAPLAAGRIYRTAYRLHWTTEDPAPKSLARVIATRTGASFAGSHPDGSRAYAVDFEGSHLVEDVSTIIADASASSGTLRAVRLDRLPGSGSEAGPVRASFALVPEGNRPSDIRLTLRRNGRPLTETFVTRWRA